MSASLTRPAKAAACANLADLLTGTFHYPSALARAVADTVVDPADVRRRLAEGSHSTGAHGMLLLPTRAWLPMLTPVAVGFDTRFMRNGGTSLSGPTAPPVLDVDFSATLTRDIDEAWLLDNRFTEPDNRAWLLDRLDRHDWTWDSNMSLNAVPLTWQGSQNDTGAPDTRDAVTLLDGSEVIFSARTLLIDRLSALGASPEDLDRFLRRDRDALRRMADLILTHVDGRAWADPAWLISVPIRLRLAVPTATGGYTAIGLADAVRADLNEQKRRAHDEVRARYRKSEHVTAPAALAAGKGVLNRYFSDLTLDQAVTDFLFTAPQGSTPEPNSTIRAQWARRVALHAWIDQGRDDAALAYRCDQHHDLPTECTCPDGADFVDTYDPRCIEHGDDTGCGPRWDCYYRRLDQRWATKTAWAARLFTDPATRGHMTLAHAREAFAAFVDAYIGFDSATTVEHAKAILTPEVWAADGGSIDTALTILHNTAHEPLDQNTDGVADLGTDSRDYVLAHLLGLLVAIDRGMFTGLPPERVATMATNMYRDHGGRAQILAFAQAHAPESLFDDETVDRHVRLIDRDGEPVLDDFGSPDVLSRNTFHNVWLPLAVPGAVAR
jgi:hypothetical protein